MTYQTTEPTVPMKQQDNTGGSTTSNVGYKRPPENTRFVKGRSGNPKGRPKRADGIVIKGLFDTQQVTKNGKKLSTREAIVRQILSEAMAGKAAAFRKFMELGVSSGLFRSDPPNRSGIIYLDRGPPPSPATYEAYLRKKAAEQAQSANKDDTQESTRQNEQAVRRNFDKSRKSSRISRNRNPVRPVDENMIAIFKRLAVERVKITMNGRRETTTLAEAVLLKNCHAAFQNDPRAINNIWRLAKHAGELLDQTDPQNVGKPIFMPRRFKDTEEFLAYTGAGITYLPKQSQD